MNNPATHLSDEEIARYCGRKMPPVELLAADDHLGHCDACYGRIGEAHGLGDKLLSASKAFDAAATDSEVTHLTFEMMAALADDRLGDIDREVVTSHLELCPRCETELNDLRELSSAMAASPVVPRWPRRAPALQEKFTSLWRRPAFRIPAQVAAALAVVVLAALVINILQQRDGAEQRAIVAELGQDNKDLMWREASAAKVAQDEIAVTREEDDRPRQAAESRVDVRVALNDGDSRVTLDSQGNLLGVRAGPRDEQAIKDALLNGRVKLPPSLRELRGQPGTLMGADGAGFSLLEPAGVVTESARPILSWTALEGAESYAVTIYDSNLTQVAASDPLTTTRWAMPIPLPRGRTYIWQVRAVKDGGEVIAPPPAGSRVKFKVLEQTRVEAIERAKRSKSHLVMGVVYAEAGLLDEAEREFAALVSANPQSQTARRLLQSVRSERR